ncbi:MAG TPA: hypothetical protein VFO85_04460, partial [Vicinamibacteria bacterium]|nr:hypothetical protein [Vicinamibacteria bacterium]
MVRAPRARAGGRADVLASTLDVLPTVLDAVKVSYPPDLAGSSLLPWVTAGGGADRERLFARNDRGLSAAWDRSHKVVAVPSEQGPPRWSLYDRQRDRAEAADVFRERPDEARAWRRELELFLERGDRERERARALAGDAPPAAPLDAETCANLRSLGYADARCPH